MSFFRCAIDFPMDSALPRDVVSINPHFVGSDAQALANALHANLDLAPETATHPHTIKVYDAMQLPPSYPLATVTKTGTPAVTNMPREVALCVSYYAQVNRPRHRGRLYLPPTLFGIAANVRPSQPLIDAAITWFKAVFAQGMPSATNMIVFSRVERTSTGPVTDIWVDDEWDTQRSRGLKGTTRTTSKFLG